MFTEALVSKIDIYYETVRAFAGSISVLRFDLYFLSGLFSLVIQTTTLYEFLS
jgi:hypothetical protein